MDDRARADMIAAIAEVDRINGLMALISDQMIGAIADLKLGFEKTATQNYVRETITAQRGRRGACVIQLPFNLS
jgi:hypothetical protein